MIQVRRVTDARSDRASVTKSPAGQYKRDTKCTAAPLLTLRPAAKADLEAIHSVIQECGQSWSRQSVKSVLENQYGAMDLAMASDDVAAIIACVTVADEVHIEMIATTPRHRRRGIATSLLSTTFKRFGDCQYFLEVSRGNKPALELYEKMGFHVYRERRQYYQDGSDALLMTRLPQL